MKKRALFAGLAGVFSTAVLAQLGGGFPGGGMPGGKRPGRGTRDAGSQGRAAPAETPQVNTLEITLEEFHEDLKLRQEQQAAWQAYADSVRALAADLARQSRVTAGAEAQTLLQRIDRVVDAARNRLAALEDIADRAKALHASLSPEQKAAADPRLANIVLQVAGSRGAAGERPARPRG
jgi:hypothetical protein